MSGFVITNFEKTFIDFPYNSDYTYKEKRINNISIFVYTKKCFEEDKLFYDSRRFFSLTEGVILNKKELLDTFKFQNLEEYTEHFLKTDREFFSKYRGSFSGINIDKEIGETVVFTNHYGDNAVYYYYDENSNKFIFSSQIDWIISILKQNSITYSINEKAVYYMLVYGYLADNCTYAREIKRLWPGEYAVIFDDGLKLVRYYSIKRDKHKVDMSEDEIVEEMDRLFRRAVRREYEKDIEYGKRHIAELSGGLDSRMGYWVAHEMGYKDVQAVTFCQSNYLDELIAKQIAAYWNEEIIVWPMDSGKNLYDIDKVVKLNYGTSLYVGVGAELRIMDLLDMKQFGVMHTGQIGDVVFGSFINNVEELTALEPDGMYNPFLKDIFDDKSYVSYGNKEEQLMMIRAFLGCLGSHFATRKYTEVASPFLDVDLIDFMLSIPIEMRINHNIYKNWIIKKYPQAAEFIWEKTKTKITESKYVEFQRWFFNNIISVIKRPQYIIRKMGFDIKIKPSKILNGMNPFDKWVDNNPQLSYYLDLYFRNNSSSITSSELTQCINKIYDNGKTLERLQVLTALATIKWYDFGN